MADRDALIVICWLIILILVFLECFHRQLKARFTRDIQPPSRARQSLTSFRGEELPAQFTPSNIHGGGGGLRRGNLFPCTLAGSLSNSRGGRLTSSSSANTRDHPGLSSKEVCQIPMMPLMGRTPLHYRSDEDEEPPPSYEEALNYSKLMKQVSSSSEVRVQCESDTDEDSCSVTPILGKPGVERSSSRNRSRVGFRGTEENNATKEGMTSSSMLFTDQETEDKEDDVRLAYESDHSKIDIDTNNKNSVAKQLSLIRGGSPFGHKVGVNTATV